MTALLPRSTLTATVEKLAPTGEGLVRTTEGVGLVDGALPGEEVDVEVMRVSRKIWRGRTVVVRRPSAARIAGGHADGCPACDWAHVDPAAARIAKRDLFLETMERIGRAPAALFGELPIEASLPGYRIRSRFHAESRGGGVVVGGFAPGTHELERLDACEALGPEMRAMLPRLAAALESAPPPAEIAVLENLDGTRRLARFVLPGDSGRPEADRIAASVRSVFAGVRIVDAAERVLHSSGEELLWLPIAGRDVPASPEAFFQANRFLVEPLALHVSALAAQVPPGAALDAYGGSGLFAAALLEAGHSVTSVEGHPGAVETAGRARNRWGAGASWRIEHASVLAFVSRNPKREDVVVADPPRAGLGLALAEALAGRARRRIVYVSCDPATLARDLAVFRVRGWEIEDARLFDLFALTHRVEAVVALGRSGSGPHNRPT